MRSTTIITTLYIKTHVVQPLPTKALAPTTKAPTLITTTLAAAFVEVASLSAPVTSSALASLSRAA